MSIALCGGGTGGHLFVLLSIAKELNKRGIKPLYIGSTNGLESTLLQEKKSLFSNIVLLDSKGVVNKRGLKKIRTIFEIIKLSFKVAKIYKKEGVKSVLSVGGYSAAPGAFGAIIGNRSLFIHEQNAHIGLLNRILKPLSKEFFSSYTHSKVKEYPVEEIYFKNRRVRDRVNSIIFLGGSQGARDINNIAISLAPLLKSRGVKIVHQCGKNEYEKVKKAYEDLKVEATVFDFSNSLIDHLKVADLAISRAGAGTLWELSALLLPSIYIPYPYAANNHQYLNAKFLETSGCSLISTYESFDTQVVERLIDSGVKSYSMALLETIKHSGTPKIVDIMLS